MKKGDFFLLGGLLTVGIVLTFCVIWSSLSGVSDGPCAVIRVDGKEIARLPLSEDTDYVVTTENGSNTVRVRDGKCTVVDADCPDKTCERTGTLEEWRPIVCLPHGLTVTKEG